MSDILTGQLKSDVEWAEGLAEVNDQRTVEFASEHIKTIKRMADGLRRGVEELHLRCTSPSLLDCAPGAIVHCPEDERKLLHDEIKFLKRIVNHLLDGAA